MNFNKSCKKVNFLWTHARTLRITFKQIIVYYHFFLALSSGCLLGDPLVSYFVVGTTMGHKVH